MKTRELHAAVDANAPFLHPEHRTIQRDLRTSAEVAAWQEGKAKFVAEATGCWSERSASLLLTCRRTWLSVSRPLTSSVPLFTP